MYMYFVNCSCFLKKVEFWHGRDNDSGEWDNLMVVISQICTTKLKLKKKRSQAFSAVTADECYTNERTLCPLPCN